MHDVMSHVTSQEKCRDTHNVFIFKVSCIHVRVCVHVCACIRAYNVCMYVCEYVLCACMVRQRVTRVFL